MKSLLAIDLPLGPSLEAALHDCVDEAQAFCLLDQRLSRSRRAEQLGLLGATAVLDSTGRTPLLGGAMVDDDIGLVMLTSGSSGIPKAAMHTWDALAASARITQATLRAGSAPVWFATLPANHIGGLAVLLRAVLDDATLLWDDTASVGTAAQRGATHVAVVRAHLLRHDVSGYHSVLLGGARPPNELGVNVITTWGMTETGSGVVYDGLPLEGVELASIDGELCVRTPTLFHAYRDSVRPRILGPDGRDDWFPTGDAGVLRDGRLTVRGRLAFVINTGGEKVWPEDLEAALGSVTGVRDVAITAADDPEWGQRVVALVVGDGTSLDAALNEAASERIGPWAKPKEIRYVAAIPRTTHGKIRRRDLPHLH